jgi:hypothetical protein
MTKQIKIKTPIGFFLWIRKTDSKSNTQEPQLVKKIGELTLLDISPYYEANTLCPTIFLLFINS